MTEPPAIRDDRAGHRLVLEQDGTTAQLVYDTEPGRLILVHTEVPDALSGRGLGGELVRAALRRAAAEDLTVVPWCPFARRWLRAHADAVGGVNVDWTSAPPQP